MCALSCPRLAGTLRRSALDLDRALQDCKPARFGTVNGAYHTVNLKKEAPNEPRGFVAHQDIRASAEVCGQDPRHSKVGSHKFHDFLTLASLENSIKTRVIMIFLPNSL